MLYKKRWSDGLNQDFEHLNEFEQKFYCFGGDGGGSGGGSKAPETKAQQDAKSTAQEPQRGFRGEQSAAAAANRAAADVRESALDQARKDAADRVQDMVGQAVLGSGYYDKPATQTAPGLADMFPNAVVSPTTPTTPSDPTKASFVDPLGNTSFRSIYDMTPEVNAPTRPDQYTPSEFAQPQFSIQDMFNVGPGTVTPSYDPQNKSLGVDFSMPFSTSSVSQQGIGSLNQNRVMDALTSGINNPQASMPAGTVQTAGMFDNVFGTLTAPLEFVGDNLVKSGNTYTSRGTGGITSTRRQPSMYDKITRTGKSVADQVGLGSLFD